MVKRRDLVRHLRRYGCSQLREGAKHSVTSRKRVQHREPRCYTDPMPTTRPRHTITETEPVTEALGLARRRWPGESESQLLRRLALAGAEHLSGEEDREIERRREALRRHAGVLEGVYPPGYLGKLRAEWRD